MSAWLRKWRRRQDRMRHSLRDTFVHRVLGERIFQKHFWGFDVNSLAGGFSLGLFVAFTPTIPFQMLFAAFAAVALRVNLPISLIACWVTNPFTALPIFLAARELGRFLLKDSWLTGFILEIFGFGSKTGLFMENSLYLWAGSLIFAIIAAVSGNIIIRIMWRLTSEVKEKIVHHEGKTK